LMTVTSMCQNSFGLVARIPSLGLAGWTRKFAEKAVTRLTASTLA